MAFQQWQLYQHSSATSLLMSIKIVSLISMICWSEAILSNEFADDDEDYNETEVALIASVKTSTAVQISPATIRSNSLELAFGQSVSLSLPWHAYVSFSAIRKGEREGKEGERVHEEILSLNEFWLGWGLIDETGFTLRLGQQSVDEDRGFWWDDSLDGIQFFGESGKLGLMFAFGAVAQDFRLRPVSRDVSDQELYWFLGRSSYEIQEDFWFDVFLTHKEDRSGSPTIGAELDEDLVDEIDDSLSWLGLRLERNMGLGKWGDFGFIVDLAFMRGLREELYEQEDQPEAAAAAVLAQRMNVDTAEAQNNSEEEQETVTVGGVNRIDAQGWAYETGIFWSPAQAGNLEFRLGYARGSGTSSNQAVGSNTFMQTGLHDNDSDSRSYGAIYSPDLSNISILSASMLVEFGHNVFLGIQHNRFRRLEVDDEFLDVGVGLDNDSLSHRLGFETGILAGVEFESGLSMELIASRFTTQEAYGEYTGRNFNLVEFSVGYTY